MTVAFASDQRLENGAEQLESLRRQMALLSEKVSGGPSRSGDLVPAGPVSLPPGTVGVLSGARSLLLSMVASVTAAGETRPSLASRISGCWPRWRWGRI